MAQHVLDLLKERGFIAQMTFEDELYEQLKNPTTFYVGFDPTADSLHIGHYIPIMAMAHMQRAGHRPIALMGGGTAMIGDPSGKTDMRKMMTVETIDNNVAHIKQQMSRFLDFSDGKAIIANNGDWLRSLNFIEFMRDIGSMFSVNKMLTAECYRRAWRRTTASPSSNSPTCSCSPTTSLNCLRNTAAGWRWAATTSGATCSAAQI